VSSALFCVFSHDQAHQKAQVSGNVQAKARAMAEAAVATFDGAGIYGVEMFVDAAGEVWLAARGCLCARRHAMSADG
jgi:formate-dependent phosphoribosylglycinamide formyltransferase (GAR transformylase)